MNNAFLCIGEFLDQVSLKHLYSYRACHLMPTLGVCWFLDKYQDGFDGMARRDVHAAIDPGLLAAPVGADYEVGVAEVRLPGSFRQPCPKCT
jgi:hypothetical protein